MRRQQPIAPYCFLFFTLFLFLSIPQPSAERLRGATIAAMTPAWYLLAAPFHLFSSDNKATKGEQLELENLALQADIARLKELFQHELQLLSRVSAAGTFRQHEKEVHNLLNQQLVAIPAQVVVRAPSSWNSSLWINIGTDNNQPDILMKNSPVIVGNAVVGVVDYVGKSQSRVRLLTDSGLTPSVRIARGSPYRRKLYEDLQMLVSTLAAQQEITIDPQDKNMLLGLLEKTRKSLTSNDESWYLAKGEIQGSSAPLWRGPGQTLKGIGFNYDFADDEGPARDLLTGKPVNAPASIPAMPLIRAGDLLVTTGYDGVFPAGLHVGIVSKVYPLKEGDYFYELEAKPAAGNLYDLSFVYIIPPLQNSLAEKEAKNG